MPRRTLRPALLLPVALGAVLAGGGVRGAPPAPPHPLLLLFPRVPGEADDRALVALRARLRADDRLDVLTFDPDSPSLRRAAADARHPEWLTGPVTADAARLDIARAVGAAYAAVVAHADRGRTDVRLLEAAPAARVWNYVAFPTAAAAESIERAAATPAPNAAPPAANPGGGAPNPPAPSPGGAGGNVPGGNPSPPGLGAGGLSSPPAPAPPVVIKPNLPPRQSPPSPPSSPAIAAPVKTPSPTPVTTPAPSPAPPIPASSAVDLTAVQPLITRADQAVARGDMVDAYALYRGAINGAPLSDVPRLKLAQAYLAGGLADKALDEAQRALALIPGSIALQEFLIKYDAENGTTAGRVARYKALAAKNPQDATVHLDLGDAFWDGTFYADAETEYKSARDLASAGSDLQRVAIAHLARLYAAMGRYDDCSTAMKAAGDPAYPLVLSVVQNSAEDQTARMDGAHDDFDAGKITRQEFYDRVKAASAKSQALADFVAKMVPPAKYSRSHLDRVQAASLLAQAAAVTLDYIESNDPGRRDKAAQLEKDAQTEMLTAHAAEQKLGLWGEDKAGEEKVGEDKG